MSPCDRRSARREVRRRFDGADAHAAASPLHGAALDCEVFGQLVVPGVSGKVGGRHPLVGAVVAVGARTQELRDDDARGLARGHHEGRHARLRLRVHVGAVLDQIFDERAAAFGCGVVKRRPPPRHPFGRGAELQEPLEDRFVPLEDREHEGRFAEAVEGVRIEPFRFHHDFRRFGGVRAHGVRKERVAVFHEAVGRKTRGEEALRGRGIPGANGAAQFVDARRRYGVVRQVLSGSIGKRQHGCDAARGIRVGRKARCGGTEKDRARERGNGRAHRAKRERNRHGRRNMKTRKFS